MLLATLLVGALDLGALTGGAPPPVVLTAWPFALLAGAVAVALAAGTALAERAARLVRVGEVLRTW